MEYGLTVILGYLFGSIPFGLVLCRLAGLGDIRKIGSGNIGATNVLRTGNKPLALLTLLLDSGKGAIAVLLPLFLLQETCSLIDCVAGEECPCTSDVDIFMISLLAGFFALIGHCYPIWLKFRGGKGVATTLGTFIAIQPMLGLTICGLWLLSALIFRISSLSALIAVGVSPIIAHLLFNNEYLSFFCAAVTTLVYLKHRENIKRLFNGEEPKISKKKKSNNG